MNAGGVSRRGLLVLQHLKRAGVDYGWSIALGTGLPLQEVLEELEALEEAGLVERVKGPSVKRTEAKLKLSAEVRRHHVYYALTRAGRRILRELGTGPR